MSDYVADYANSYALVMAVDGYEALPPLGAAVKGAQDLAALLETKYRFAVTLLTDNNLTRDALFSWLNETRRKVGPNDRVIIYFAGHGMTRGVGPAERGYLCLPHTIPDEWHTAIPMDDITQEAEYFICKHLLYVLDCCFSGMALAGRGVDDDIPRELSFYLTRKVRYAITAGGKEVVDDSLAPGGQYSLFTYYLMNWLSNDRNKPDGGVWRARELGNYLEAEVTRNRRSGHKPNHSYLTGSGDGDFVFRWETGTQLPREIDVPLIAVNPRVRLGAVTALIDLAKGPDYDMAALARATLQKVAKEDTDSAIRQVAGAFLEGREIGRGDATASRELLEKLEAARREQQEQARLLAEANQQREAAVAASAQSREQMEVAEREGNRLIYRGPFLWALTASLLGGIPLVLFLGLATASTSLPDLELPLACAAWLFAGAAAVIYIYAGTAYTSRAFAINPRIRRPTALLGGAVAPALGGLIGTWAAAMVGVMVPVLLGLPSRPGASASTDLGLVSGGAFIIACCLYAPGGAVITGIFGALGAFFRLATLKRRAEAAGRR
jgi:hypothetical protein